MLNQGRNYTISRCVCMKCGLIFPIPRKKSESRQKGHIKSIWCPECKDIEKFLEIRNADFGILFSDTGEDGIKKLILLG